MLNFHQQATLNFRISSEPSPSHHRQSVVDRKRDSGGVILTIAIAIDLYIALQGISSASEQTRLYDGTVFFNTKKKKRKATKRMRN